MHVLDYKKRDVVEDVLQESMAGVPDALDPRDLVQIVAGSMAGLCHEHSKA
jgi:hypothetical protein